MLWNWKIGEGIPEEAAVKLLYLLEENIEAETGNKENGA